MMRGETPHGADAAGAGAAAAAAGAGAGAGTVSPGNGTRVDPAQIAQLLLAPGPHDHKYTRGVLAARTGSRTYPGAAVLTCRAALGTGIGMLRYVPEFTSAAESSAPETSTPASAAPQNAAPGEAAQESAAPAAAAAQPGAALSTPEAAVLAACPEAVFGLTGRAPDAILTGSGTDPLLRSTAETAWLEGLAAGSIPFVADAGALDAVARALFAAAPAAPAAPAAQATAHSSATPSNTIAEHIPARTARPVLLTPHAGEFAGILRALALPEETSVGELAQLLGVTVLLKGSVTQIAGPSGELLLTGPATPWLATAGTGDVLAGIAGALLAAHAARTDTASLARRLPMIAATAAILHDQAARAASGDTGATGEGHPVTAGQVADAVPLAFARLRATPA